MNLRPSQWPYPRRTAKNRAKPPATCPLLGFWCSPMGSGLTPGIRAAWADPLPYSCRDGALTTVRQTVGAGDSPARGLGGVCRSRGTVLRPGLPGEPDDRGGGMLPRRQSPARTMPHARCARDCSVRATCIRLPSRPLRTAAGFACQRKSRCARSGPVRVNRLLRCIAFGRRSFRQNQLTHFHPRRPPSTIVAA